MICRNWYLAEGGSGWLWCPSGKVTRPGSVGFA